MKDVLGQGRYDLDHVRPLAPGAEQVCVGTIGKGPRQFRLLDLNAHGSEHGTTVESVGMPTAQPVTGLLLAAGQGARMGAPKATVEIGGRTLTERAVQVLLDGGCADVIVIVGAQGEQVRTRLEDNASAWGNRVVTTECATWASGMSESLRTGLATMAARGKFCPAATLIHLVDLPDIGADVVARVLEHGRVSGRLADVALRATYQGVPGHPTLLGQSHWQGVMDTARGDRGAGPYLRSHATGGVVCDDLALGADIDTPTELTAYLKQRS